ncbi:MAG: SHOCT domain-containing protein [Anaerolineae bacterium]
MMMPAAPPKRNRLWLWIGGLLLLFAFAYLLVGVILRPVMPAPFPALIDSMYDTLLCGPDEEYQQDPFLRGGFRRNIVGEGDAWCLNAQGVKRDISYSEFNVAIALFVVPLIAGFIIVIAAVPTPSRSSVFRSSVGGDLSARLEELQAAYDKGLISSEEYEITRQNILKQMER